MRKERNLPISVVVLALTVGCYGVHEPLEVSSVTFNSQESVRVQWRYWTVMATNDNQNDVPPTQLEVFHNDSLECGQTVPIEIHNKTHVNGYYDQVIWGVDSRRNLTLCVRVHTDGTWKPWQQIPVPAGYRMPPLITEQPELPKDVYSAIPQSRVIHCGFTGSEPLVWEWIVNDDTIRNPDNRHYVRVESGRRLVVGEHDAPEFTADLHIRCSISNSYGSVVSDEVVVKKPFLEPRTCGPMDMNNAKEANFTTGARLTCGGYDSSFPAMRHTWRFCPGVSCRDQGNNGGTGSCPRVVFNSSNVIRSNMGQSIVFPYVRNQDVGCYECVSKHPTIGTSCRSVTHLTNSDHMFNFPPKALLKVPPDKLNTDGTPQTKVVHGGETYRLECAFQGKPVPSVSWYHKDTAVAVDDRHTLTDYDTVLTIRDIQVADQGIYRCVGNNTRGQNHWKFRLHVNPYREPVIRPLEPENATVGENITLACETDGVDQPIMWYKNEQEIREDSKGYMRWDDGSRLMIVHAEYRDTGSYTCHAKGSFGEARAATTVLVMEPVKIQSLSLRVLTMDTVSTQYQLRCNASSDANVNLDITWSAIDCPAYDVTINVSDESPDLAYVNAPSEAPGCYLSCEARAAGRATCLAIQLVKNVSQTFPCHNVPKLDTTDKSLPAYGGKTSESTEEVKPWYEENLYVLIGTTTAGAIILVACIAVIIRRSVSQRKKRCHSRNGGILLPLQYTQDNHVGFVNNSIYPTSFGRPDVSENLKNQLKEVEIPRKSLSLGEMIGRGQFGRVYKGTLEWKAYKITDGGKTYMNTDDLDADRKVTVAIKTLKYKADEGDMVDLFLREALMMKGFDHPHVLRLIGITSDTDRSPLVILPFMERGDLRTYISSPDQDFRVLELLEMGVQVANGMSYLAAKRFVHRDLAARNCMVNKQGVVKVADFGLSRDLYSGEYYRTEDGRNPLPIRWMAAESLESKIFTSKSDVWSFGVLLWELVTRGATPYPGIENWAIARHIHQGGRMKQPLFCPNSVYELMLECWAESPKLRPSFETLQARLETVTAGAGTLVSDTPPGAPSARRGTLHMDIRGTRVTKVRGPGDTCSLSVLKETC